MNEYIVELWKLAPAIVVLGFVLWAGTKGYWYWGSGVRLLVENLEKERDQWKMLALGLLSHCGIDLKKDKKHDCD